MSNTTAGLTSAIAYADRYTRRGGPRWIPPTPDEIRELRSRLDLSQPRFASLYGFDLVSLRKWEQGRGAPEQTSCMVLRMIQIDPEAVAALLTQVRTASEPELEPA